MAQQSPGTGGLQGQRIDVDREQDLRMWARKLNATEEQLREAVAAVGPLASDVEDHLKGSRATTNSERTRQALKEGGAGG